MNSIQPTQPRFGKIVVSQASHSPHADQMSIRLTGWDKNKAPLSKINVFTLTRHTNGQFSVLPEGQQDHLPVQVIQLKKLFSKMLKGVPQDNLVSYQYAEHGLAKDLLEDIFEKVTFKNKKQPDALAQFPKALISMAQFAQCLNLQPQTTQVAPPASTVPPPPPPPATSTASGLAPTPPVAPNPPNPPAQPAEPSTAPVQTAVEEAALSNSAIAPESTSVGTAATATFGSDNDHRHPAAYA